MLMCSQLLILLTLNKNGFPFGSLKFQRSTYTYVQVYSFHALQQQFSLNPNVQQYTVLSPLLYNYTGALKHKQRLKNIRVTLKEENSVVRLQ